jgi:DNA-binding response OmpR family regulator
MASKKILIVDDEPPIIDVLRTRLTASGYETCTAGDGVEAVEKVKSEKPDLIIMDVMMPRMTGFEALKKIREMPESRKTPALVISAKGSMRDYFTDITGVEFIPKPYDAKELVARVGILVGDKAMPHSGSRRVILAGVEDFLIGKIRNFLSSQNYQVLTALNEDDAFTMAKNLRPGFILCQFWEEASILDPKKLGGKLAEHASLVNLPLYVYCKEALSIEAMKTFKGDRLITHNDSVDLLKKLELTISKMAAA